MAEGVNKEEISTHSKEVVAIPEDFKEDTMFEGIISEVIITEEIQEDQMNKSANHLSLQQWPMCLPTVVYYVETTHILLSRKTVHTLDVN